MSNDILTLEIAEQFLEDPDSISFGCYTSIEDAAAESLSKYQGNLNLYGLTELSDAAAESLSKYQGNLYLYGLTELSDAAAESLSKHKGATLDLTGLTEFSDSAAEALAKYRGCLYDGGLIQKNEHDDSEIGISSANVLTPEIAEQFLEDPESIELHEFTVVDEAAAEILAGYDGYLNLSGLKEIPQEVAEHLGIKLVKDVRTDNEELSVEGIKTLEDIESCVVGHLEHCLEYNDQSGFYFTDSEGNRKYGYAEITFGVCDAEDEFAETETITEEIARQYCKDLRDLVESSVPELSNFKKIDDDAAEFLSKNWLDDGSELDLNGLTTLSDAAADSLSKLNGSPLQLGGISDISDAAIKKIALYPVLHDFPPSIGERLAPHRPNNWLEFTDEWRELISNVLPFYNEHVEIALGVTKLSETDAKCLLGGKCELYLDDLTELSDAAAETISKYQGDLSFDSLTELSDAAAESLSKHQGRLYLSGLTKLSDAAAEALGKHKGNLSLGGLTELSDAAAEALGKHQGELSVSDQIQEQIDNHKS
jgi:hypothetical protein